MELSNLVRAWRGSRVVVVGDVVLDVWLTGRPTRIAREAPVPVVTLDGAEVASGAAANTAANLAALGAQAVLVGAVGADSTGDRLRACLAEAGVEDHLVRLGGRRTVAKVRLLAGGQLVVRFDDGHTGPVDAPTGARIRDALDASIQAADTAAVVVCDYGCASIGPAVREWLIEHRPKLPVLSVDAHDLEPWASTRPDLVTPSLAEVSALLGAVVEGPRAEWVCAHRPALRRRTGADIVAVTLDVDGSIVLAPDGRAHRTTTVPAPHLNATGAGDAYTAAFTLALASGARIADAAEVAQRCATAVTRRPGTGVCTASELITDRLTLPPQSRPVEVYRAAI